MICICLVVFLSKDNDHNVSLPFGREKISDLYKAWGNAPPDGMDVLSSLVLSTPVLKAGSRTFHAIG